MFDLIYDELLENYYDYYCTVYFEFIKDAILNTLKDLKITCLDDYKKRYTIKDIHKNIIENYI